MTFEAGDVVWFTAKDLTHIQRINFQSDNGAAVYADSGRVRAEVSIIAGNSQPYHDYAYFDFTDPAEDKNSAVGIVATRSSISLLSPILNLIFPS